MAFNGALVAQRVDRNCRCSWIGSGAASKQRVRMCPCKADEPIAAEVVGARSGIAPRASVQGTSSR